MSQIQDIAKVVRDIVNEVIVLEASYSYPQREVKKPYPALSVLYDGFTRPDGVDDNDAFVHDLKYALVLYLPMDNRELEAHWEELIDLMWAIVLRFANDRTLDHNCRQCEITAGEPVVHMSEGQTASKIPISLGHTFDLVVRIETEEDDG